MPSQIRYNFESTNPFGFWTSNGAYKIHEISIVNSGDPSFGNIGKFDIEFIDATYLYLSINTGIPLSGSLKLSGNIRVEHALNASVAMGANIAISPVRRSGVYVLNALSKKSGWISQTFDVGLASREKAADLIDRFFYSTNVDDVGVWLDRIGLFIRGKPGGRIVFNLDQIQLDGEIPDKQTYLTQKETAWTASQKRILKGLKEITAPILNTENSENRDAIRLQNQLQSDTNRIFSDFAKNGFISPEAFKKIRLYSETARHMSQLQPEGVAVYPWEPTSPILILPKTNPVPAKLSNKIAIQACRGEFEPASFIIRSTQKLPYVTISVSDLSTETGHVIPHTAIDTRLVKCWFQAGSGDMRQKRKKTLVPELLLKDNDLVHVDLEAQTNTLRGFLNGKIQYFDITHPKSKVPADVVISDAEDLQPFDLPANFNQQTWLTIKIPEITKSGRYSGTINIMSLGKTVTQLDISVQVLPFDLPSPALEYAIYYRGKLVAAEDATIGSDYKSDAQYKAEMADLKAHGIQYPTIYQTMDNFIDQALDIRNEIGFPTDKVFSLGVQTKRPFDDIGREKFEKRIKKWKLTTSTSGYDRLFVYGIDEAKDDLIAEQLPVWKMVNDFDSHVFVACPHHADTLANRYLELGVLHGPLDHKTALRWTSSGLMVYSYGNPQVGIEDPSVYRRNYGFQLWLSGYTGAMNYAYQHAMGNIWNDFDHSKYRDHVFAYPSSSGLISTIQWEGFREAIDDMRYWSAYKKYLGEFSLSIFNNNAGNNSIDFEPSDIRNTIINSIIDRLPH